MATLDVTEILSDPDFCDTVTITRETETIGSNGRPIITTETFPGVVGVIVAGHGDMLKRFPELTRVEGSVMVYTTFRLAAATQTTQADQMTWNGVNYRLTALNDWTNFGAGFVSAIFTMTDLLEASPT